MSKTTSLLSALLCTFVWGTTFIAQDTGMDNIGPFTFNAVRFFIGFLAITPLVFLFELKKFKSEFKSDIKIICKSLISNRAVTFFRFSFAASGASLHRCCKCSFFYNFLCSHGSYYNFLI